jgi:predicted DNA-binding transcriptional regulator AlpA
MARKTDDHPKDDNRDLKRRIGLADITDLSRELGVSPFTIRRWVKAGHFPKPLYVSAGAPARWRVSQIEDWLDKAALSRRKRPAPRGALKRQMGDLK